MSTPQPSSVRRVVDRWQRQPLAVFGLAVLFCFVCATVLAPHLAPYDPAAIELNQRLAPPQAAHWFGTDELAGTCRSDGGAPLRIAWDVARSKYCTSVSSVSEILSSAFLANTIR